MTGDFPQEKPYGESVDEIRREFFKVVGSSLSGLAQAMDKGDVFAIFKQFIYLIATYLDSIDTINDKIERVAYESSEFVIVPLFDSGVCLCLSICC